QEAAAPAADAAAAPSQLALQNDGGRILYAGTVPDGEARNGIIEALTSVFGASAVTGDVAVDPSVAPPAWLDKLSAALGQFKIPGAEMLLKGDSIDIGGLLSDENRNSLIASLKSLFGDDFSVGKLTESLAGTLAAAKAMVPAGAATMSAAAPTSASVTERSAAAAQATNEKAAAALKGLPSGYSADELVEVLNASVINFETGSAVIAASDELFLRTLASGISGAPAGSLVEVGGHTDSTGNADANLALSQARAEAVRDALVRYGVNPASLAAKGYGGTQPVASNETVEGRDENRRIEFAVVK
ncbi:MAG TPA: OmpA family protein, partial [Rhodospirillales bacterium]|nr:OmpA family protein [Rhodospirillales bacterium]